MSLTYVRLAIKLITLAGKETTISGEFHIVPSLACGMIAGTDVLLENKAIIDFPRQKMRIHQEDWVKVYSIRSPVKKLSLKKRGVYAAEARIVEPGHGVLVPVKFRHPSPGLWHTVPVPQHHSDNSFAAIPAALISSDLMTLMFTCLHVCTTTTTIAFYI